MRILVTGVAGFIGFHVARRLLDVGCEVVGIDCVNAYYDVRIKEARLRLLEAFPAFRFHRVDIVDGARVREIFEETRPARVIHLAAQAGVRYSMSHPHTVVESNVLGFLNMLEACRHVPTPHFVYASSSSVYGGNTQMPFSVRDNVDHPLSLYAATKKANELMAHTYSHLYRIPTTGLRFFTVYGPWGRPDMALFIFTRAILDGRPIPVFNQGQMYRDFTYIDDIVEGVVRVMDAIPPDAGLAPYQLYNIGNHQPVELLHFIEVLERCLGREAVKEMLPMQPGDVPRTCADIEDLHERVGFRPTTSVETGISRFVEWYLSYFGEAAVPSSAATI